MVRWHLGVPGVCAIDRVVLTCARPHFPALRIRRALPLRACVRNVSSLDHGKVLTVQGMDHGSGNTLSACLFVCLRPACLTPCIE